MLELEADSFQTVHSYLFFSEVAGPWGIRGNLEKDQIWCMVARDQDVLAFSIETPVFF